MKHQDQHYIQSILTHHSGELQEIYRLFLPPLYGMVRRQGGTYEDARDVFQESLVVIFRHASRPGFQLTAPFQAYLMGIARFIWLRLQKKNARVEVTSDWQERYVVDDSLEQQAVEVEKHNLYREMFARLGVDCREVLQRYFNRERLNTIASDLGYTEDYIKKKNKVCKEKLMEFIQSDARYRELTHHPMP
ncbi:MAG TPA: sigma-70 family RNA polymerase sigma factor [Saprospiraceae bacterium]|nr:sigma-70 family RNA polymerase sigma factor [Saprospiraceae bacterium]